MNRQTVTIEIVLTVDAELAATLEGRPAPRSDDPRHYDGQALSGLQVVSERLAESLLEVAVATLEPIGAERVYARDRVSRPYDDALEPF